MNKINSKELLKKDSIIATSENNDCTVYAIATAFDMSYDEAHKEVSQRFKRVKGKGAKRSAIVSNLQEGTTLNGKTVTKVLKAPTTPYKLYGNIINRKFRLYSFAEKNPEGTYVILTRGHALTIKNGTVIDNLSKTKERALVEVAFKID